MKLDSAKVFIVGNPPPGFGGRYFVFVKLGTRAASRASARPMRQPSDEGHRGNDRGCVCAALYGRDPFQIEAIWREAYGSGFTLRPMCR